MSTPAMGGITPPPQAASVRDPLIPEDMPRAPSLRADLHKLSAVALHPCLAEFRPLTLVMLAVELDRWPGFGPVAFLPLTIYIQVPSALNVMSCGS